MPAVSTSSASPRDIRTGGATQRDALWRERWDHTRDVRSTTHAYLHGWTRLTVRHVARPQTVACQALPVEIAARLPGGSRLRWLDRQSSAALAPTGTQAKQVWGSEMQRRAPGENA